MDPQTYDFKPILDFDFGVSEDLNEYVRVSALGINEVTTPEVKLILWILLERAWGQFEAKERSQTLEVTDDETDGDKGKRSRTETDGGSRSQEFKKAKQYTLELLKFVGLDIPFDRLTEDDKSQLLGEFSASSELLAKERYTTILELYEALRRRSKFREQFQVVNPNLGRGRYGTVKAVKYAAESASSSTTPRADELSAVKQIVPAVESLDDILMILNESTSLRKLVGHPNVIQYYDSWLAMDTVENHEDPGYVDETLVFYLHMELCSQSLRKWKMQLLKMSTKPPEFQRKCEMILEQVFDALTWVHGNGILHLDLNPNNIFWKDETHQCVKIGDFGLAVQATEVEGRRGTSPYCAPEEKLTSKSDVYSAGVTIFEIAQLTRTTQELVSRVSNKDVTTGIQIIDGLVPFMLLDDPARRPLAKDLQDAIKLSGKTES